MKIQQYNQSYETQVVDLWNKTLIVDPITVQKFRKQALFDDNFDSELCLIALVETQVVGFLLATKRKFPYLERGLEPKRGWINVMFVDPAYQHQGIGEALVKQTEATLKTLGVESITLGAYSPNYFFPGIDKNSYQPAMPFFNKLGYQSGEESYSMSKDLHGFRMNEDTLVKRNKATAVGFTFINFDYCYALDLLAFAKEEFGGGWKRNILMSMQKNQAEQCILLVLNAKEEIVGFCMRMIDGNPMRFGPIGIKADVRNFGIGGILFELMQWEMEKQGIHHMFFVSTDGPGRRFYERHGMKVYRTYVEYQKTMLGEAQ